MGRHTTITVAIVAALTTIAATPHNATAQPHGGHGGGPHGTVFVGGYFYDPFFGPYPWWGPGMYGYPYFPVYDNRAQVHVLVTPKEASVFVDGYYAGSVDDFNGTFESLPLSPGGHEISLYLDGYRTVHQKLFLSRDKSYKVRYTMEKLAAGERSEEPSLAPPVPPPPPGSAILPHLNRNDAPAFVQAPAPPQARESGAAASGFGTLALRAQPPDAEVLIDGEKWTPSQPGERLDVQVTAGVHHVVIQKPGYHAYAGDITVSSGETRPVNVSLSSQ